MSGSVLSYLGCKLTQRGDGRSQDHESSMELRVTSRPKSVSRVVDVVMVLMRRRTQVGRMPYDQAWSVSGKWMDFDGRNGSLFPEFVRWR